MLLMLSITVFSAFAKQLALQRSTKPPLPVIPASATGCKQLYNEKFLYALIILPCTPMQQCARRFFFCHFGGKVRTTVSSNLFLRISASVGSVKPLAVTVDRLISLSKLVCNFHYFNFYKYKFKCINIEVSMQIAMYLI